MKTIFKLFFSLAILAGIGVGAKTFYEKTKNEDQNGVKVKSY